MLLLAGLFCTVWFTEASTASELARTYAFAVGISLGLSLLADLKGDPRNLVRTDIMGLASLYFLTLFEFVFRQPMFDTMVEIEDVRPALHACLVAFAGLAIGRHYSPRPPANIATLITREFKPQIMVAIFALCLVGGYGYMLIAVDFNFLRMIDFFMAPRFAQPWGRGMLGDWKALLVEVGMVLYLIPPLAGVILANRRGYSPAQVTFVVLGLVFTLFYGFTSGTRNILATYLATFLVAYAFTAGIQRKRELITLSTVIAVLFYIGSIMMLDFRNVGFSRYLDGQKQEFLHEGEAFFFVDYNLYVISQLMRVFPHAHDYLGLEIPYLALIRPIPRAIWSGKPEGMSMGIEESLGAEGLTLASTFIGEAYMSGGFFGVAVTALCFGVVMCWWNKLGRPDNSSFGHLIFASGFFAAVISMRSMLVFTTAILPTIAALIMGHWLVSRGLAIRQNDADHHSGEEDRH